MSASFSGEVCGFKFDVLRVRYPFPRREMIFKMYKNIKRIKRLTFTSRFLEIISCEHKKSFGNL